MNRGRFCQLACRLALGVVFIYAAAEKIYDPAAFAQTIDNYRLFPAAAIGPLAIALPWLELLAGALVIIGPGRQPAALILAVLLVCFMAAVGYNLHRGLDFECGCFGGGRQAGLNLLWQDGLLLICALTVICRRRDWRRDRWF